MNVKKPMLFSALIIFLFSVTLFYASGVESDADSMSDDYGSEIYSYLDDETRDVLSSFGIDSLDFDSVFNISFTKSLKAVGDMLKSSAGEAVPYFFKMLAMLIILAATAELRPKKIGEKDTVATVFSLTTVLMTAAFISDILTQTVAVFNLTGKLLLLLAPIITALLSVSGNVTASVLYNSVTVAIAQIISAVSSNLLIPLIGVYLSFVISLDISDGIKGDKLIYNMNKILTGIFAAMSTGFTFVISIKNVLAKELDGVLYKSGKYVISSFIPVVGSNISAMLSSVIGSLELVKSTVAVFGVICVAAINIPVLAKLCVSYAALSVLGVISDLFSVSSVSSALKGFSGGVKLLIAIVFFELVLVIISLGLTVMIRGSV